MSDTTTRPFSNIEALRYGWRTTQANLKPLLTLSAVGALLALFGGAVNGPEQGPGMHPLLGPGVQLLQIGVGLAFVRVALKLHDGQPVDLTRTTELFERFFPYLLTSLLYSLIVAGGMLLLVVPGVIWAIQFGCASFLVADGGIDPIEALRESSRLTRGAKVQLFGFGLLLGLVNLAGALALGIGLLVTVPTTFLAVAYAFRRLQVRAAATARPEARPLAMATSTPATNP